MNVAEAETVSGDFTYARGGANSYVATVTKLNGIAVGALATLNVGTGLTSSAGSLSLTVPVAIVNGGTGSTAAPVVGQIPIATTTSVFTPTAISGDATLASTGALTVTKTGGVAFTGLATAAIPLSIANGGRGSSTSPTVGQIDVASSTSAFTPVTMSGDATITSLGAITVTKLNGTTPGGTCTSPQFVQVISASGVPTCATPAGGGTVTSVALSGGTTGLTVSGSPITSSGTITLAGTLAIANGGTGATTAGAALTSLGAAPLASPTFTGTVTIPAGASIAGFAPLASPNFTGTVNVAALTFSGIAMGGTCGGGQFVNVISSSGVPTCATPAGGALPSGTAGQFVGYPATGTTGEAETLGGDATLARTGANAYSLTVTKTNGVALTGLATATIPLSIANGGTANSTAPSAGQLLIANSGTLYAPATMSGDCTITAAGAITCTKTNGSLLTSLFAPQASPTFTGTMTFPDGSTYTSAGHNSMARLGIGTAAPTGQYYLQITSANASNGTYVNILNTATAGAAKIRTGNDLGNALSFGSLGSANASAPDEGGPNTQEMFADGGNMSFLLGAANGIYRFVNNAGTGTGPTLLVIGGSGGGGGGLTVGAPTGGDKGIGTVNATNYYVNGTAISAIYAPQASPTFTGTVTMPDATTITSAGFNNSTAFTVNSNLYVNPPSGGINASQQVYTTSTTGAAQTQWVNNSTNHLRAGITGSAFAGGLSNVGANESYLMGEGAAFDILVNGTAPIKYSINSTVLEQLSTTGHTFSIPATINATTWLQGTLSVTSQGSIDSNNVYNIPNASNQPLATCSGLYIVSSGNSGDNGMYNCGSAQCTFINSSAGGFTWQAASTAPAAGKASVQWNGSNAYTAYNNTGASMSIGALAICARVGA